jgi:uncharacterized protein YkwD
MSHNRRTRTLIVIVTLCLSLLLAACGGTPAESPTNTAVAADPTSAAQASPVTALVPPEITTPGVGTGEVVKGNVGLAATPVGCTTTTNPDFEAQILQLTNAARAKVPNLPPLKLNSALTQAAQAHAMDMACNNKLTHTGSNGSEVWHRVAAVGYQSPPGSVGASFAGENIAKGPDNPAGAMEAWLDSPGHAQNLKGPQWTELGVGYATRQVGTTNVYYWVQVLSNPDPGCYLQGCTPTPSGGATASTATQVPSGTPIATRLATTAPTATTASGGGACSPTINAALGSDVIKAINVERRNRGLSPLTDDPDLASGARNAAKALACGQNLANVPGSNLTTGMINHITTADEQARAWTTDKDANTVALSASWTMIGIGYAQINGNNYWVLALKP